MKTPKDLNGFEAAIRQTIETPDSPAKAERLRALAIRISEIAWSAEGRARYIGRLALDEANRIDRARIDADAHRDALIASDAPSPAVALALRISEQRVRQLRAREGDRRRPGRPPSSAVTAASARGCALLAALVADAAAAGLEPEEYLARARAVG